MKRIAVLLLAAVLLWSAAPAKAYGEEKPGETQAQADGADALETQEKEGKKEAELNLHAQSAVLLDGVSGRVLYGKNQEEVRPMASTTKIMTCILALEYGNPGDTVTVSKNAAGQPKVHLGASAGETFYLKDLLYSLMLESHNDTAVMVAEHIGGSVEGFAGMMNQKARDLGCQNTYFITPNGLDASVRQEDGTEKIHSTTAEDLGRIMRYCVLESPKREEFLKITETQNYYFSDAENHRSYQCVNHNAFLQMMDGVLSGKTGFTGGAGYSYTAALEDGGRVFVVSLLGCGWPPHKAYKWADAKKLFTYGLERYQYREVFEEPELEPAPVLNGIPDSGDLGDEAFTELELGLKEEEKSLKLLMSGSENVSVSCEVPKSLTAPVQEGQAVGAVTFRLEGKAVKAYPVYVKKTVEKVTFSWCLRKVASLWQSFPGIALSAGM